LPAIIILDLNLPGLDGRDVLVTPKQDEAFSKIPIIVFTSSSSEDDVQFCYQQGANGYMVKPLGLDALKQMVQAFVDYWLGANTSPFFLFS
jgi:CheY-like chemotaxis protein